MSDVFQQDRELIAADPTDGVAGSRTGTEPPPDLDEQPVPLLVTELIVDQFEAVQVEEHDRDLPFRARQSSEGVLESVHEQRPVWQPGQDVVRCFV